MRISYLVMALKFSLGLTQRNFTSRFSIETTIAAGLLGTPEVMTDSSGEVRPQPWML